MRLPARVGRERARRVVGGQRRAVERADVLASVAAEEPVADRRAERLGRGAALLDRQVADAPAPIELARSDERLRRARVEAERAAAAALGLRRVGLERGARQHRREHEVRAEPGHDQAAVLPDEADARALCPGALDDRHRVAGRAGLVPLAAQPLRERTRAAPGRVVVVAPTGVAGDAARRGADALAAPRVRHREDDDAHRARQEARTSGRVERERRIDPRGEAVGHVRHHAVPLGGEPRAEAVRLDRERLRVRDAHAREAERAGLGEEALFQRRRRERHSARVTHSADSTRPLGAASRGAPTSAQRQPL